MGGKRGSESVRAKLFSALGIEMADTRKLAAIMAVDVVGYSG